MAAAKASSCRFGLSSLGFPSYLLCLREGRELPHSTTYYLEFMMGVTAVDGGAGMASQLHAQLGSDLGVRRDTCKRVPQDMKSAAANLADHRRVVGAAGPPCLDCPCRLKTRG